VLTLRLEERRLALAARALPLDAAGERLDEAVRARETAPTAEVVEPLEKEESAEEGRPAGANRCEAASTQKPLAAARKARLEPIEDRKRRTVLQVVPLAVKGRVLMLLGVAMANERPILAGFGLAVG
jgi:hypothetical protein